MRSCLNTRTYIYTHWIFFFLSLCQCMAGVFPRIITEEVKPRFSSCSSRFSPSKAYCYIVREVQKLSIFLILSNHGPVTSSLCTGTHTRFQQPSITNECENKPANQLQCSSQVSEKAFSPGRLRKKGCVDDTVFVSHRWSHILEMYLTEFLDSLCNSTERILASCVIGRAWLMSKKSVSL